jgi:hypothetical protein
MLCKMTLDIKGIIPYLPKKDTVDVNVKHRERRLSITYRKVIMKKVQPINPDGKVAEMLQEQFHITANT